MEIFIIRHGQSCNNARRPLEERQADPALTDLGQRQSAVLAEYLATGATVDVLPRRDRGTNKHRSREGYGITSLYCSPMYRSLQTAVPVSRALGIKPKIWVDIHERGGLYCKSHQEGGNTAGSGMTRGEILEEFPNMGIPSEITDEGWWHREFEDVATTAGRAIKVASEIRQMGDDAERVAIISHGGFIDVLLKALFSQLPGHHLHYSHHNTGISRLTLETHQPIELRSLNRVDHLPPDLVS